MLHSRGQAIGRPLLTPDECSRLPRSKSIIVRNGFSPSPGDKIQNYEIPALLERSRIAPLVSDRIAPSAQRWWEAIAEKPRRIIRTSDAGAIEPKSSTKEGKRKKKAGSQTKNGTQVSLFDLNKKIGNE